MDKIRQVMLALLLLVYTGQSLLAVGAPCTMGGESAPAMDATDHAHHHDMGAAREAAGSCCEGGFCSMSHCQSAAALPQAFAIDRVAWVSPRRPAAIQPSPETSPDRLFRPPISR